MTRLPLQALGPWQTEVCNLDLFGDLRPDPRSQVLLKPYRTRLAKKQTASVRGKGPTINPICIYVYYEHVKLYRKTSYSRAVPDLSPAAASTRQSS